MIEQLQNKLATEGYSISPQDVSEYLQRFENSQHFMPLHEQQALIIKLIERWKLRGKEKILIISTEYQFSPELPSAINFGIISSDWPGLSDSCIGAIHLKGWNVHQVLGVTLPDFAGELGIILVSVVPTSQEKYLLLKEQQEQMIEDIQKASVGNITKVYLLAEEIKKLQIYSSVIDKIEELYLGEDLDRLIGMEGEAVKFFAARSREYVENRSTTDIAWQIITNHEVKKKVQRLRRHMQVDIRNFSTKTEGEFTGISIAGMPNQINLDDLLQTIEHVCPAYQMKHQKKYTTDGGITVFRFEIITQTGSALNEKQIDILKKGFKNIEVNRRRERQSWLETIGGFEHYARAIIPFLIKQNQNTGQTQVYLSVQQSSEKIIDFKILIVLTPQKIKTNSLMYQCINKLDAIPGFYISKVKPPSRSGESEVIIVDLKVDLTINPEMEEVYVRVKKIIEESFGKFRDFDEGMRQMDLRNFNNVKNKLVEIGEASMREIYYSLEDFYRVTAPVEELATQIQLALQLQRMVKPTDPQIHILWKNLISENLAPASIIVISLPSGRELLQKVLALFEAFEVVMSKQVKNERDILICRLSQNRQALPEAELDSLVQKLQALNGSKEK